MKKLILPILCLSFIYTQCNETNWQDYTPNLWGCTFTNADLSNIDFSDNHFRSVIFINSDFSNSDFSNSYLESVYAVNSNFESVDFRDVSSEDLTFVNCNLRLINFSSTASNSNYKLKMLFSNAELANFTNSECMNCHIINSNFENAIFSNFQFRDSLSLMSNYFCGVNNDDITNALIDIGGEGESNTLIIYDYGNIFENCPAWDFSFNLLIDLNNDTYDDESYNAGATSGDNNIDGTVDIIDIVNLVNMILE